MKIFLLTVFFLTALISVQGAGLSDSNITNGYFKKAKNGQYIQYNNKNKKIGIYKIKSGRYVRIK